MRDLRQLTDWMREQALPLWADAGFDAGAGVFAERLDFDLKPVAGVPRRLMVQARQVAVFCDAERLKWMAGAGDMALRAAGNMVAAYRGRGADGGWAFSLDETGAVADAAADLYAHAFALYALSRCARLEGPPKWRPLALETLKQLERLFACPGGGYAPGAPICGHRLQNPLMHLLEALLDLCESCGDDIFASRAEALRRFALERLIDPATGALHERFDAGWHPAGSWIEPGHLHEWAWLLTKSAAVLGGNERQAAADLRAFAARHGHDGEGYLVDELTLSGAVRAASRRLWPHTEALRAELVCGSEARAAEMLERLHLGFLAAAPRGGWIDRIDASGRSLSPDMPASSLYHLAGAAAAIGAHSTGAG